MTAAVGLMAGGAAMSAGAQRASGKAQQRLAEYNAQVGEVQADDAIARGREDEGRHRVAVRGLIGSQRAALAASGVDVNSGTASEIQEDTARQGELDALTIRLNAAREAWGYKVQAGDSRARGAYARAEGNMQALGTIVSAAGSYANSRWGFGSTKGTR
jgi:hypothetical protein